MSAAPLLAALYALRTGFLGLDVISPAESITVDLSYAAGQKFETWLATVPPAIADELRHKMNNWGRERDGHREIELRGVKIRWPHG